jgi:hypothetical protein
MCAKYKKCCFKCKNYIYNSDGVRNYESGEEDWNYWKWS